MGRKKGSSTRRKQKVQLEDNKKPDSSRATSNYDYAQMTSTSAGLNKSEPMSTSDEGTGTDQDEKAGDKGGKVIDLKLAGFLKEIQELGSSEQQGEMQVDNGQGPTHEQGAVESNSGETSYSEVSSEAVDRRTVPPPQQQQSAPPPNEPQLEVTFWQEVMDPNTNHAYYWNPETNEVTWTLPANGVINNEEMAGGTGTGQSGMENETSTATKSTGVVAQGVTNSNMNQDSVKTSATVKSESGATKVEVKVSKRGAKVSTEVDMFEDTTGESKSSQVASSATNAATEVSDVHVNDTPAVSDIDERSLRVSNKRKASPEPLDGDIGEKEPLVEHQVAKKQRLATAPVGGGGPAGPREKKEAGNVVESGSAGVLPAATSNKHAEQMLRFQVSNFADELSRKLQYLHVSSEGLSDLQILHIQLQTRLTDWKEGGLSSKYMLSKLKQFNTGLETYERSSAPEGWKFVWDSSTCRYKFYNLSTGESSWSYPVLGEHSPAPQEDVMAVKEEQHDYPASREDVAILKKKQLAQNEEELGGQEDAMETEQQPVGPVQQASKPPQVSEVATVQPSVQVSQPSQAPQQKPKQVKPDQPAQTTAKVAPTFSESAAAEKAAKNQKQTYQVPTAEYLRAPDGPVVLPVSRFQKRMEEKQAELENPVESWNLSVRDVRKILSGKRRRSQRSASKDDVIREGDYPDDDDDDEMEARVTVKTASVKPGKEREGGHQQEFIAEFPPRHEPSPPRRQTRSSTSKKVERSSTSPVGSGDTVIATQPKSDTPTDPRKRTTSSGLGTQQRHTSPSVPVRPIPQPTALPPPHLKTPVTMVISRDPRIAKRQQQLIEKAQDTSQPQQQQQQQQLTGQTGQTRLSGEGNDVEISNGKSPPSAASSTAEATQQKSSEVDEARMRERLLLRQKYRIRKTSDRRDSREGSSEERQLSPPATTHPTPPPQLPVKSCLVKSPTTQSASTLSPTAVDVKPPSLHHQPNVAGGEPNSTELGESHHSQSHLPLLTTTAQSLSSTATVAEKPGQQQTMAAPRGPDSSRQGDNYGHRLQGQRSFIGGVQTSEDAVEQSTGELELSPHKKAVFFLDTKNAPVDVTLLPPMEQRPSPLHEVLSDSRVEPETGEVESMNMGSARAPGEEGVVGTESSAEQVEASRDATIAHKTDDTEPVGEEEDSEKRAEVDKEAGTSSESSEDEGEGEDIETRGGVATGQDQDDGGGVGSDKEEKEEESDQSDQDRHSRSSRRKKRRHSSRSKSRSRSRSRESRRRSGRKTSRRRKHEEQSDYSDNEHDKSDEDSEDHHRRSSRRSSKRYGSSKYDSKSSRRSSRKHHYSRSHSQDSRERNYWGRGGRSRDRDRPPFSGSGKHKKRDKKEKKKKRHRSSPKYGSGDEKNKPQPNVLVGKVGKVGSVRTLGQDRKPSELEEGDAQNATPDSELSNQIAAGQNMNPQQQDQAQLQQQYQQMGYYQHTGQMPYYGTTTGTYQDYMYGYSQDPYQQQAAWQAWHQQQASGDGSQQAWASATSTGHAQNHPQYIAYPIGVATPPPPPPPPPPPSEAPPTTSEAPPTASGAADGGGIQAYTQPESTQQSSIQQDTAQLAQVSEEPPPPPVVTDMQALGDRSHQPSVSLSLPAAPPLPPLPPSEEQDTSQPPSTQPPIMSTSTSTDVSTDKAAVASTSSEAPQPSTVAISTAHTVVPDAIVESASAPAEIVPVPPAIEEGAETPPITPPTSKMPTGESIMETAKEEAGTENLEDEGGEEIMECDMEIDDDESPEEEATVPSPVPVPPTDSISVATSIPVSASSALPNEGQKVSQDVPPSSREISRGGAGDEDDEPLPPGVEEEKEAEEPLPPGMEDASGAPSTVRDTDKPAVLPTDKDSSEPLLSQNTGDITTPEQGDTTTTVAESATTTAAETAETTTTVSDVNATPPVAAAMTMAQAPPTSYVTASTSTYPGATQYSYAYGQGYGDYAAYNAYLQQAAYAGYPGQYYQAAYGSYGTPYAAGSYYGTATGSYTTTYQQQTTSQPSTSTPSSTDKPPPNPKVMMEQWNAFQEAATKK